MKITGSRWELQIEDDNGNVAGFSGEACPGEFLADAASLCWIRHKGEAAQGDGMDLIRKVTEYTKDSRDVHSSPVLTVLNSGTNMSLSIPTISRCIFQ